MKNLIVSGILSLSFSFAMAQAGGALPVSLAKTMKAMSTDLKTVSAQVGDAQANANSALLADQFVTLVLHAKDFVPDSIASLPANQQAAATEIYDKMLDQTADLGKQLAAAFRANDNALAQSLLSQLSKAKSDGHDQFKQD